MRRLLSLSLALVLLTATSFAQEAISRTVPIARPSIDNYVPGALHIELLPNPRISVTIVHIASGVQETFSWPCTSPCTTTTDAQTAALITALNTANLTTRTLWRRVFDKIITDYPGRFPGGASVQ